MGEKDMIEAVQAALEDRGIDDKIVEVGQFEPRGMTGSIFAGGMLGGEAGDAIGGLGGAIGTGAGMLGGIEATKATSGLPTHLFVGASDSTIYGFKLRSRRKEPHDLLFEVPRAGLEVKVHGRVNVRILELIDPSSGSKIELEGNRLPITHSHDLIKFVAGEKAAADADDASRAAGEAI
jgi:hypothetical protein